MLSFFFGVPGMALSLEGLSPLHTREGEMLAELSPLFA